MKRKPIDNQDPQVQRRRAPLWKWLLGVSVTIVTLGVLAGLSVLAYAWAKVEIPEENQVASAQTSIVYWNDGKTELARLGDTNRIPVPLSQVPKKTQQAVLAAEDRTFYDHGGFSPSGLARAAWENLTTGSAQGGSTITQQYTKNAFLSSEKTYDRKLRELIMSIKLERELSKDEILERYLNTIYFGRGAYGIETAAEAYFGVSAKDLTLEQGAVLAAIINAPGRFSPESNMDRLETRYAYVLDGMLQEGYITQARHDKALKKFPKIIERKTSQRFSGTNGYLVAEARKEALARGFTEEDLESGGLRIVTTFDQKAQQAAVDAVKQAGPTTGTEGLRIGLASVEPGTGEVVALYGGEDYLKNSLNNATQAIAQAGSTFKPFALAAAVDQGIGLWSQWPGNSPHTVRNYTFQNYANNSYGSAVSLLTGTQNSINSTYVELENKIGVDKVREMALAAGIPTSTTGWDETNDLTFVLGTASPHTIDVASAYATFAARGVYSEPTVLRSIKDASGEKLYSSKNNESKRTINENTADVVNYALQTVVENGTGRPAQALGRPAAAKTGSTDEYLSAWFAGYTPQLATAVSFSKDDKAGNPVSLSGTGGMGAFYGSGYPARVWTSYMKGALAGEPIESFVQPASLPSGGGVVTPPQPDTTIPPQPSTDQPGEVAAGGPTPGQDPNGTDPGAGPADGAGAGGGPADPDADNPAGDTAPPADPAAGQQAPDPGTG